MYMSRVKVPSYSLVAECHEKLQVFVTPEPIVSVVANSAVSCACDATIGAYRGLTRQLYEKALKGVIAGLRPRLRT